jgi:hypothetical protein
MMPHQCWLGAGTVWPTRSMWMCQTPRMKNRSINMHIPAFIRHCLMG